MTQGGKVCDNKPDTEGTKCKMRMHFKIKPETPAGSAAASGYTPRPLGVTRSPSSALRGTSGGRLEEKCLQRQDNVLSSSQKAPGSAHRPGPRGTRSPAHLLLTDHVDWNPWRLHLWLPRPASLSLLGPEGLGLYLDPVPPRLGPWAGGTGQIPSRYLPL